MFFLVVRIFRLYSLSSFQIFHAAVLTRVILLFITFSVLNYLITESLYFTTFIQFPHLPPSISGNYKSDLSMGLIFFFFFFFARRGKDFVLDFTCKWNPTVFVFLCLTYFTQHNALRVYYVVPNGKISSFLWLNSIPWCVCVCVTFCLCIYLLISA